MDMDMDRIFHLHGKPGSYAGVKISLSDMGGCVRSNLGFESIYKNS